MSGQVLVAGAGPVGLTMAAALKRLGVDLRIVDSAPSRTDKSKALVLWPRTLELLDIQGFVQGFLDAGIEGHGARIYANGHELLDVRFDTARSVYRFAQMIPQSETERLLEEELARLGVTVEREVTLQSFTDDGAGVDAVLRRADGGTETMRAEYLLGCDGAHSAVRHGLGIEFAGSTEPSEWMLADLHIDGDISPDELTICWQQDGLVVFFPIVGGRFRVVADTSLGSVDSAAPPTLEEIQAVMDARGPKGLRGHDPFWLSRFRINERKVKDYRRGRVFLSGDAAHVHSPAGGQGMNTGMQDAFNLSWKIAQVMRGHAKPELLDSYSPERSAIGDQVLHNAATMTHVGVLRNPILQEIRNAAAGVLGHIPMLRQRMVDQLTEVDLNYEGSPLTGHARGTSRHPAPGHRAQDVLLMIPSGGWTRLHEILRDGHFAVLSVGTTRLEIPHEFALLAASERADEDPNYAPDHHYLIRPDGYVALSTSADSPEPIFEYLARIAA
jgi:2-polyprenyl-6-methoxyphenol hydroxylase-like FAD-dependent oxidoreductase